ncbi:MAG TPA: transport protein RbsD/FucU [Lentisphaeria bacterium]|nr:transport protein RbsD/FucU [Lentisphaeria bacterium]
MLKTALLNPDLNELLGRIRHTNTVVIADRGFPYWPMIETIDIALVDDQPSVFDVLKALLPTFTVGGAWMAEEFFSNNSQATQQALRDILGDTPLHTEPHDPFKTRVPQAIGLIRTGGTAPYSNIILESA